jgi:uncharacterized tellurite resistance protein B-like protein
LLDEKIRDLSFDEKKLLLSLIYNILISDQDYSEEEKYLFGNLVDFINVPFNFNQDMKSKKDIILEMKTLSNDIIYVYLEVVRMAILADGIVSDAEIQFLKDMFEDLSFSIEDIQEKIDYLKYGEKL